MSPSIAQRFESKYLGEPNSGCWLWTAGYDSDGYGRFWVNEAKNNVQAQRVSWLIHRGKIPDGLCVCHKCDTRGCVNPDHLWLGTNEENTADRQAKGRQSRGEKHSLDRRGKPGPKGELNRAAKITAEIAQSIRADSRKHKEIAQTYGVSQPLVSMIKSGKIWRHI